MTRSHPHICLAEPGMHPLDYSIEDFLHAKALKRPKTRTFYNSVLSLYRQHAGRHWPPTDSSINSFLAACNERGLKPSTIYDYYTALRCWCNWLHKRGNIEVNPIQLMERPAKPHRLPRAPQAVHIAMLLASLSRAAKAGHWRDVRDCAAIGLIYDTGLRVSEAAGLMVNDLHMQSGTAVIRHTKSHRDRVVCFNHHTGQELGQWLEVRPIAPTHRVFLSKNRTYTGWGPLTPDGIRYALERCCKQANVPRMTPHALRHAHAIHFLRARGDVIDLQAQLGHADLDTTQVYAQVIQAGRSTRHELHSPRSNLGEIVANETSFSPTDS